MKKLSKKERDKLRKELAKVDAVLAQAREIEIRSKRIARGSTKVTANAKGHRTSALKGVWL